MLLSGLKRGADMFFPNNLLVWNQKALNLYIGFETSSTNFVEIIPRGQNGSVCVSQVMCSFKNIEKSSNSLAKFDETKPVYLDG